MASEEKHEPPPPGKQRRRKPPEVPNDSTATNMTPMIDCVFQLLIFFMVAARFKSLEGKLLAYLPKTMSSHLNTPPPEYEKLPIRLTLLWNAHTRQAKVYVGQQYMGIADRGGLGAAERRVQEIRTTGTDKAEIDAQPVIPFRYISDALNTLIRSRVKEISFAAAPRGG